MKLHDYLSDYVTTLQTILATHQDEESIINALIEKYGQDDARLTWILQQLTTSTKKGFASDDDESKGEEPGNNEPSHKFPERKDKNV